MAPQAGILFVTAKGPMKCPFSPRNACDASRPQPARVHRSHRDQWKPIVPPLKPGVRLKEQMRIVGKTVAREAKERRRYAAIATAFQLYTLTHEPIRERLTEKNRAVYRWIEKELVKVIPAKSLPMPDADKAVCSGVGCCHRRNASVSDELWDRAPRRDSVTVRWWRKHEQQRECKLAAPNSDSDETVNGLVNNFWGGPNNGPSGLGPQQPHSSQKKA
jgi:hypothetical protein